jgi:hypothetical protein
VTDGDERLSLVGPWVTFLVFVRMLRIMLVSIGIMLVWPGSRPVMVWFALGGAILANRMRYTDYWNQEAPLSRMVLIGLRDTLLPMQWDRRAAHEPGSGPVLRARRTGPYRTCVWGIRALSVSAVLYLWGPAWWWLPFLYVGTAMVLRALRHFGAMRGEVPLHRILAHLPLDVVNPVFF